MNPFIKVEWEDTPENLTQERIKRVKTYFENKYNSKNVKIVTKIISNNNNSKLKSLDVSDNILDFQYQKKIVKDFIEDNKIDVKWELLNRLDDRVNGEINKIGETKIRYNKWNVKRIEFSNFLSFGEDNYIEFTKLNGITVVESNPRNFGGKTTATVDLLLFLFFNTTTKTKTNIEIFNKFSDKDEVKVKGYLTIDGEDYIITRTFTRKKSKSGEYKVENTLEYGKSTIDGNIQNLSGEQSKETEKIITSAIGTEKDFLLTILTTGNNLEDLIDSKPTDRGEILTKFLGLENLKQKEEICKDIYSEWSKKLVSNTNNIADLEEKNQKSVDDIEFSESEIERLESELTINNKLIIDLEEKREIALKKRNQVDQELIKLNPDALKKEIQTLEAQKISSLKLANDISVVEPSSYYLEDDHEKVRKELTNVLVDVKLNNDTVARNEKILKQFEEGSVCPTCKRALDDVDHTDEINIIKEDIAKFKNLVLKNEEDKIRLETKEKEFSDLKKEYDEYERNKIRKAKYELESEQKQFDIDNRKVKLEYYENNKLKLDENQKIDSDVIILKTQIESTNGQIRIILNNIEKNKNNITSLKEKIEINNELIKKIKSEEELVGIFKTYLTIYGKNGITKVIMKNMIPLLNQELFRLLSDSCYFTLELNINDKNELEFLMIDNETRVVKPLSSGSGYEKTVASLAIRSVLTKVSSLPKPNIVVMDEVFGKIADDNLEMVGEFFKKIKNYFEHIFVISHNPLIRNWSDNILMIKKDENLSSIDYVTTKIS